MNDPENNDAIDDAVRDLYAETSPDEAALDRWVAMARRPAPAAAGPRWLNVHDGRLILAVAAVVLAWLGVTSLRGDPAEHGAVRPIVEVPTHTVALVQGQVVGLTIPDNASLEFLQPDDEVDVTLHPVDGDPQQIMSAAEVVEVDVAQSLLRVRVPAGTRDVLFVGPGASLAVAPTVDKAAIKQIVTTYMGQLKYCYELQLRQQPNLGGRVVLRWTIANERARDIEVTTDTVDSEPLTDCMAKKIARWEFPGFSGPTEVSWPFVFRAD